jgi:serine/threonine-protein kinase
MIARARDGSDLVKVVDFGIAKAMGGGEGQTVTRTGLVVGTPEYMSPEQLSGDKLDGRSDVYSLSLVFFRMITGTLPFQADSAQEVMIKRLTDDPARLSDSYQGTDFPPQLQVVMDHAMERMPSDRYATAEEFAREVLESVASSPPSGLTPSVDTQGETQMLDTGSSDPAVTDQLKKTRVSEAQATVSMSEVEGEATEEADFTPAATPVSLAATPPPHTPETPMPQAAQEAPRKKPILAIAASIVVVGIVGGVGYVTIAGGGSAEPGIRDDTTAIAALLPGGDSTGSREQDDSGTDSTQTASATQSGMSGSDDSNAVDTPESTVNIAEISAEFITLGRQVGVDMAEQTRAVARRRAQEIYDVLQLPDSMKARAASIVAESYEEQSMEDACTWVDRAIRLQPGNEAYRNLREFILGCPS